MYHDISCLHCWYNCFLFFLNVEAAYWFDFNLKYQGDNAVLAIKRCLSVGFSIDRIVMIFTPERLFGRATLGGLK